MRNKLLAALALCGVTAFSTSSWAGDWVKPTTYKTVVPTLDQNTEGESYYIQHVATGKFLTAANYAGTQLSVGDAGQKIVLTYGVDPVFGIAESNGIKNGNYKTGYESVTGWMFSMPGAPSNRWSHYVYPKDNSGEAYVDMGEEGHILWDIVQNENGTYTIKIVAQDFTYGGSSQWNENGNVNTMNGVWGRIPVTSGPDNTVVNVFCDKGGNPAHVDAETEWAFVSVEEYENTRGRIVLIDAMNAAEVAGITDVSKWAALLDKEQLTLAEIETAKKEMRELLAEMAEENPTPENPYDMTSWINNPSFSNGTKTGWTCTDSPSTGTQNRNDGVVYGTDEDPLGYSPRYMDGFVETWQSAENGGRNGWDVHQTITGLPAGKYRVSADMLGLFQGTDEEPKGYYVYAQGVGDLVQAEGGSPIVGGKIQSVGKCSYVDVVCDGTLLIGVKSEETNCNWMSVDNFRLQLIGYDLELSKQALNNVIAEAESVSSSFPLEDGVNYGVSVAEHNKLKDCLAAAKEIAANADSNTTLEIQNAYADLSCRLDTLNAGMKVYEELYEFLMGESNNINVYYDDPDYGNLIDGFEEFNDLSEAMYASMADGLYSAAEIPALYDSLKVAFQTGVKVALKEGKSNVVTTLLVNPTFDDNTNTGWSGQMDSAAGEGYPITQFWAGRCNTYDQYQVLTGLPEGSYTVTVQAFYRPYNAGGEITAYTGADNEKASYAYLYGNDAETRIKNVVEEAVAETAEDAVGSWIQLVNATDEYANMWVPDDRQAANYIFSAGRTNYLNSVTCYVGEDGELRLGIRKTDAITNHWACADNFTVTYLGYTAEGKLEAVKAAVLRGQNAQASATGHYYTADVEDALNTAVTTANGLLDAGAAPTVADCDEAIAAVDAAIVQFNKSMALADEVYEWASTFDNDYANSIYDPDYYEELSVDVFDVLEVFKKSSYATYEELETVYNNLLAAFAKAQQDELFGQQWASATKDAPLDVTALITNPNFEVADLATGTTTSSIEGWTLEYEKGTAGTLVTNVSPNEYTMEVYNALNFRFYQTLRNLPEGTYKMTFEGFYRAGGYLEAGVARRDGKEAHNVFAYAALNGETEGYPGSRLASIFTEMTSSLVVSGMAALPDTVFGKVQYVVDGMAAFHNLLNLKEDAYHNELYFGVPAGGGDVTIGLGKDVYIANDWCIFDTFKLYYLGAGEENDPVAVEGVSAEEAPVSTTWYTIDGVQVNKPAHSGLYIRVQRMADGTVNTAKVLVK